MIEVHEIHQMMVFLLDHIPPQMHLVILPRSDPPFPLARYRARGELSEIRFLYLVTTADAHPQVFCGSFSQPHGQGYTQNTIFSVRMKIIRFTHHVVFGRKYLSLS